MAGSFNVTLTSNTELEVRKTIMDEGPGQRCQTLPLLDAGGYCHVDFGLAVPRDPRGMWRFRCDFWSETETEQLQ